MSTQQQRRSIRKKPERSDTAFLRFKPKDLPALIIDESAFGCCLVLSGTVHEFEPQQEIEIQFSRLGFMSAKIRWMSKIDSDLIKMGIEFELERLTPR